MASSAKRMVQLSDEEVQWVLSRKSKGLSESDMVSSELAALTKELSDGFVEHQAWMRREFEANGGVVLVEEEEFLKRRAEQQELVDELSVMFDNAVDFTGWMFSDCPSDFFKDEDDDSEEEDEEEEEDAESN